MHFQLLWGTCITATRPSRNPNNSDEYIADENLLLGSHVIERRLEEVSADDDQTAKVNNTVTNTSNEALDMSKIRRAGPLTFDPCPDRTHD